MQPGLYVHVPFCRGKCHYCDFYSCCSQERMAAWLAALAAEIILTKDQDWSHPFDSLYLGGGTPSLLPPEMLTKVFLALRGHFPFVPAPEITLEANPDDVTLEKLRLWRQLGVNRLSLGIQSLNDAELRFLGRRHDAAQARRAVELARLAGFENLNVDLMYALPGQTMAAWQASLAGILAYRPEHLSCYQLTVAEHTPLGERVSRRELVLPGEEEQRTFFLGTSEFLAAHGYGHYEVSNFALRPQYFSRHNCKYWQHVPYLGLGPAAHSFDGRRRWWNVASVAEYCRQLAEGREPVAGSEVLTDSQLRLETLALGLRTRQGVARAILKHFPQADRLITDLCETGFLEVQQERLCPTREGLVVADSLAMMLSI